MVETRSGTSGNLDAEPADGRGWMTALLRGPDDAGSGEVHLGQVRVPTPGPNQVLVRVRAASATLYGWDLPPLLRAIGRLVARARGPRADIPGLDFAGEVVAVGRDAVRFQLGAPVFGWSTGALAPYVAVAEDALALKPARLSYAEAAALATPGFTALQALRKAGVADGDDVLVVGASGGVGSMVVQLAKAKGATVTGVCRGPNAELVRSLGADHVLDYTTTDVIDGGAAHDVIVDMAGNRSLSELRQALRPDGTLVMVGQAAVPPAQRSWPKALRRWLGAAVLSVFVRQRLVALIQSGSRADLTRLRSHVESGDLIPTVTERHPIDRAPEAIAGLEEGHGRGRVVIEFPDP